MTREELQKENSHLKEELKAHKERSHQESDDCFVCEIEKENAELREKNANRSTWKCIKCGCKYSNDAGMNMHLENRALQAKLDDAYNALCWCNTKLNHLGIKCQIADEALDAIAATDATDSENPIEPIASTEATERSSLKDEDEIPRTQIGGAEREKELERILTEDNNGN